MEVIGSNKGTVISKSVEICTCTQDQKWWKAIAKLHAWVQLELEVFGTMNKRFLFKIWKFSMKSGNNSPLFDDSAEYAVFWETSTKGCLLAGREDTSIPAEINLALTHGKFSLLKVSPLALFLHNTENLFFTALSVLISNLCESYNKKKWSTVKRNVCSCTMKWTIMFWDANQGYI